MYKISRFKCNSRLLNIILGINKLGYIKFISQNTDKGYWGEFTFMINIFINDFYRSIINLGFMFSLISGSRLWHLIVWDKFGIMFTDNNSCPIFQRDYEWYLVNRKRIFKNLFIVWS